ncbi:MAG TPA: helix-turn-helix transcriptional regulator [Allosphingosinicella sp.]|jgi:transcriptional regulator with XRE-family HTH domain
MPNITASNLRLLRIRKGLTLDKLAEKARVDRGTINRIESGRRRECRRRTLEQLAEALDSDVETLSGPPIDAAAPNEVSRKSQMNVRMADEARNALSLVAMRYGIKPASILHLAPFLFLWAAEQSLRERRESLERLEEQWAAIGAGHKGGFRHLDGCLLYNSRGEEVVQAERSSIAKRDLFGLAIPDEHLEYDYEESEQNPITQFLARLAGGLGGLAQFDYWSPYWDLPGYSLGRDEASALVDGDEDAVHHILAGNVGLHEVPKDIREAGPPSVAAWVKRQGDAYIASLPNLLDIVL